MKLRFTDEDSPGPLRSWDLTRRLEILLSLWKRPKDWQALSRTEAPFQSTAAAKLWAEMIEHAEPVEPVSTTNGLRAAIQRRNAKIDDTESPWSLEFLQARTAVRIIGSRAAIRDPLTRFEPRIHGGRCWRLTLGCDQNKTEELEEICRQTFATVERIAGELSMEEALPLVPQSAGLLAGLAFGVTCEHELVRLWQKAVALGVDISWLEMLHPLQRRTLAESLANHLRSIATDLHWSVDLELAHFAAGQSHTSAVSTFATRMDELFAAQWALGRLHDSLAPEFAFGQMAAAVALAGDDAQVGNLLTALPPGRAYFSAVGMLQGQRPRLLASLLAHPAWAPEAMFALADWKDALIVQGHGSMAMHEEWHEVAALSRRLALFHEQGPNYSAVTALAVHDETRAQADTGRPSFSRPIPSVSIRLEPWHDRLEDPEHTCRAVDAVVERLDGSPTDPDLIFALRLLPLLEAKHPSQANRLASVIARAYTRCLSMPFRRPRVAPNLLNCADLLDCLGRILRQHDDQLWQSWCIPFDVASFVRLSHEWMSDSSDEDQVLVAYQIPRYIRSHANNLLALAETASESLRNDLLEYFVALFEHTHTQVKQDPWGWSIDADADREPVRPLIRLGQILQRIPEHAASKLIARVEIADATELQLAELLAGLRDSRLLADGLRPRVEIKAGALLTKGGISLGEANHLGRALYHCGLVALAERCALYALGLLEELSNVHSSHLQSAAIEILLASRVAQEKWQDVDEFNLSVVDPDAQLLVENWRALAALARGRTDEALQSLRHILRQSPKNRMALANIAAVYAERHDWSQCVSACAQAKNMLGEATPAEVYSNEVQARYHLGDFAQAVAALNRLPPWMLRTPAILQLRIGLAVTSAPVVAHIEDELRQLEKIDPATADLLRARLAPLSQAAIGGGWFASDSLQREFVSLTLEERCAKLLGEDLGTHILKAVSSAAQRIVEQSALALELSEDQLTQLLCLLLVPLEQLRIYVEPMAPGGLGPKKQGIADFLLSEMPSRQIGHGRRIVRGEAKEWRGAEWMTQGIEQIFATGNSGQELFLLLVVYCKEVAFQTAVNGANEALARFGADSDNIFSTLDPPERVLPNSSNTQCIFKTNHGSQEDRKITRTLYTVIIDVRTEGSRSVRRRRSIEET